jgi:hypothetical protein
LACRYSTNADDVRCRWTFGGLLNLKFDRISLCQAAMAITRTLYRGIMDEEILTALARNETEPFSIVEPLDLACKSISHLFWLLH